MKKVALAIMVMFMMGSLFAPVCYAGETQDITMNVLPFDEGIDSTVDETDEEDGEEILPPSDEEYVIDSVTLPWYEYEEGEPTTKSIINRSISFRKTAATKATAGVSLKASAGITKLNVNIRLQKKIGSTYKSIGTATTHQANSRSISCRDTFSVEKSPAYRIKITVKEYAGSTMKSKMTIYESLKRNGY